MEYKEWTQEQQKLADGYGEGVFFSLWMDLESRIFIEIHSRFLEESLTPPAPDNTESIKRYSHLFTFMTYINTRLLWFTLMTSGSN